MIVERIAGLEDPRVAVFRSLRRAGELRDDGHFVCEGTRVVRQLLRSDLPIHTMLLEERWLEDMGPSIDAHPGTERLPVFLSTKQELEGIVGFSLHQGVMAEASVPQPPPLLDTAGRRQPHLFVALEGVSSAENVGGLIRSCAGFGADGLIFDRQSHDPFVRRAARVSMGAIFHVPLWRSDDLAETLVSLRDAHGTRLVAAHLYDPVVELDRADLSGNVCIVLGSEATGLTDRLVRICDQVVKIPMDENWGCLNVATAGAVFLWEAARRRRA